MDNKHLHSLHGGRFTAETLLAYRRGTLGETERRRLERAMEADAFLRDALEGLSIADPQAIEQTLAALNRDVEVITGQRRAWRLPAAAKKYAAAAMILAFFSMTLLIMNRLNKDATQQQLAMQQEKTYPELSNADTGNMGSGTVQEDAIQGVEKKASAAPEQPMANTILESDMPEENATGDVAVEYTKTENEEGFTAPALADTKDVDNAVSKPAAQSGAVSDVVEKESLSRTEGTIVLQESAYSRKKQKPADKKETSKNAMPKVAADNYSIVSDSVITTMPEYPGGQKAMDIYFTKNLQYPAGTPNGTAYVEATISSKGKVSQAVIKTGLSADADKEIVRVVNAMPEWKPGTVNGKAVEMQVLIPVTKESN